MKCYIYLCINWNDINLTISSWICEATSSTDSCMTSLMKCDKSLSLVCVFSLMRGNACVLTKLFRWENVEKFIIWIATPGSLSVSLSLCRSLALYICRNLWCDPVGCVYWKSAPPVGIKWLHLNLFCQIYSVTNSFRGFPRSRASTGCTREVSFKWHLTEDRKSVV